MSVSPSAKFEIIMEMMNRPGNRLKVKTLCKVAGVSRSGYYAWLKAEDLRREREAREGRILHRFWMRIGFTAITRVGGAYKCVCCTTIRPYG